MFRLIPLLLSALTTLTAADLVWWDGQTAAGGTGWCVTAAGMGKSCSIDVVDHQADGRVIRIQVDGQPWVRAGWKPNPAFTSGLDVRQATAIRLRVRVSGSLLPLRLEFLLIDTPRPDTKTQPSKTVVIMREPFTTDTWIPVEVPLDDLATGASIDLALVHQFVVVATRPGETLACTVHVDDVVVVYGQSGTRPVPASPPPVATPPPEAKPTAGVSEPAADPTAPGTFNLFTPSSSKEAAAEARLAGKRVAAQAVVAGLVNPAQEESLVWVAEVLAARKRGDLRAIQFDEVALIRIASVERLLSRRPADYFTSFRRQRPAHRGTHAVPRPRPVPSPGTLCQDRPQPVGQRPRPERAQSLSV